MITWSRLTKTGNRDINEDTIMHVEQQDRHLFIVADGLGGHDRGEVASAFVANDLSETFLQSHPADEEPADQWLSRAVQHAQEMLLEKQIAQHAQSEMKTTVVVLYMDAKNVCWAHVGDSRLYGFSRNKVKVQTLDHSIPQMLVLSGEISQRRIRNHPQRNMLLRVVGVQWDRPMQTVADVSPVSDYQAFLMCTDGFWELITEREMCRLLKRSSTPEEWLNSMTELVEKHGRKKEMDNYSAIAVWTGC